MDDFPKVSVVIVNLNGIIHLRECFNSILKLNYPKEKIEVVVVDNGSTDGSVALIQEKYPWVRLVTNTKNEGFAKPSNDGARAASGEYVAFINNDMRVEKDWLIELVNTIRTTGAQCAGSVILNWDGSLLDFAGGGVTYYGMGFQDDFHKPIAALADKLDTDRELLFACGGAMLVERQLFLDCGGFDPEYFAYFEDLDLGWRLNVLGHKVVLSVKSRVYHKHHSTGSRFARSYMDFIYGRNSLYTIYKNFSDDMLKNTFLPAVLMNFQFIYDRSGLNKDDYDLRVKKNGIRADSYEISDMAGARIASLQDFVDNLDSMSEKRRWIQANRKVEDSALARFFPDPTMPVGNDILSYGKINYSFAKNFGIPEAFGKKLRQKVLIVSSDKVGVKMAGSAIRYYEFAKALAGSCDVTLASCGGSDLSGENFRIISYTYENPDAITECAINSDIILVQGYVTAICDSFYRVAKEHCLIIDLYDPYTIEHLEIFKDHDITSRRVDNKNAEAVLSEQLTSGDYYICANSKQRDYWLGMLSAAGRITPETYDLGRNCENLIGTVPYGIPDEPPVHSRNVLKGVWPGINKDDKVLIWGGGVWNWFDPLTLIKAVRYISQKRQDVKLFFMGVKHPNPGIPTMKMVGRAVELAKELNVLDKYVFFNYDWVDYNDRQNYLLEADIGVSCHFDTLETHMSFRTRILDYLWADLPIVCTKGDYFGELVESERLGFQVEYEDEKDFSEKILRVLDNKDFYDACKGNVSRVAETYRWKNVTMPLADYCKNPVKHKKRGGTPLFSSAELETADASGSERMLRKGSVPEMLRTIDARQQSLEQQIRKLSRTGRDSYNLLAELQEWSIMMNTRFNKMKKAANPLYLFRRLFRKIFRRR